VRRTRASLVNSCESTFPDLPKNGHASRVMCDATAYTDCPHSPNAERSSRKHSELLSGRIKPTSRLRSHQRWRSCEITVFFCDRSQHIWLIVSGERRRLRSTYYPPATIPDTVRCRRSLERMCYAA
jgi:hypothetical protein